MTRLKGRRTGSYYKDTDDDGCADRVRGEEEMRACALGGVVFYLVVKKKVGFLRLKAHVGFVSHLSF